MTKRTPAFYHAPNPSVSERYWRLKFVGTNSKAIELGEVIFLDPSVGTTTPNYPVEIDEILTQIRQRRGDGNFLIFAKAEVPTTRRRLLFNGTRAQMELVRNSLWGGSDQGEVPVLLVPDDNSPEVYFARLEEIFPIRRIRNDEFEYELRMQEQHLGVTVS